MRVRTSARAPERTVERKKAPPTTMAQCKYAASALQVRRKYITTESPGPASVSASRYCTQVGAGVNRRSASPAPSPCSLFSFSLIDTHSSRRQARKVFSKAAAARSLVTRTWTSRRWHGYGTDGMDDMDAWRLLFPAARNSILVVRVSYCVRSSQVEKVLCTARGRPGSCRLLVDVDEWVVCPGLPGPP